MHTHFISITHICTHSLCPFHMHTCQFTREHKHKHSISIILSHKHTHPRKQIHTHTHPDAHTHAHTRKHTHASTHTQAHTDNLNAFSPPTKKKNFLFSERLQILTSPTRTRWLESWTRAPADTSSCSSFPALVFYRLLQYLLNLDSDCQ